MSSSCCPTPQKEKTNGGDRFVVEIGNATRILRGKIPIGPQGGGEGKKKNTEVELIGRSWAGDSTAFVIPSLGLALDAGYPVYAKRMDHICITHTHTDHCHHLTHLKSRSKPPNVYTPTEVVTKAQHFIDVAQQLTSNLTPEEYDQVPWDTTLKWNGVRGGDRIVMDKKKGLICHVVSCDHTVPCVGYCFSQMKQSLRPEYQGLSGREIGKLRKSGVQVTTTEEQPLLCFLGDTSTSILSSETTTSERIFSCPTIIIECSFLTEDCRDNANRTKHVLWTDLKPYVLSHPDTTFVLIHFSHRWNPTEIANFFQNENLPNVIPWIPSTSSRLFCQSVGGGSVGSTNTGGDDEAEEIEEVFTHF